MNKLILILFSIVAFLHIVSAQDIPVLQWEKTYGSNSGDQAKSVYQTSTGEIIVAGYVSSSGGDVTGYQGGGSDFWVIKLDSIGDLIWQYSLGGTASDKAEGIIQLANGDLIIAGVSFSNNGNVTGNHGIGDIWVIRLDINGNLIWQKTLGGSSTDGATCLAETSTGNIIVAGHSGSDDGDVSFNNGGDDVWVVEIDDSGNLIWENSYGGSGSEYAESIAILQDGSIVIAGWTESSNGDVSDVQGLFDYWLLKISSTGTVLWENTFGGSAMDRAFSVIECSNSGFLIAGYTESDDGDISNSYDGSDSWVIKTDSLGNLDWQKVFGGTFTDQAQSSLELNPNEYQIAGFSSSRDGDVSFVHGNIDVWIFGLDSLGNLLYEKTFGGSTQDLSYEIYLSNDGSIYCAGLTLSSDGDISDILTNNAFWILKYTNVYSKITGSLFTDLNTNLVLDGTDTTMSNIVVENQNTGQLYFSNQGGDYVIPILDTGSTVVDPSSIAYYDPQPPFYSIFFDTIPQVDSLNDFAFQPTGSFNDLEVGILPMTVFRPGFSASYTVHYRNVGTTSQSSEVTFFTDYNLSYDSSSIAPDIINSDSLYWQLPDLNPYQEGEITIFFSVDVNAMLGDSIYSSVRIDPIIGDADASNNWGSWPVVIQGSFDPNDILVDRKMLTPAELIPTPPDLEYIIRFQNTGTDTAFTVRIENSVPQNTDLSTFQFVSSSHNVEINYLQHVDRLEYRFENILLPDSNTNEAASHGYFRYKIKPLSTLMIGDSVLNWAGIYFDYNSPVITNTAVTVIDNTTGVSEGIEGGFYVSPNPTSGLVYIQISEVNSGTLTLTDITGREVIREAFEGTRKTLNLSDHPSGVYILHLETRTKSYSKKIVLE